MNLRNNQITLGELLADPKAKTVLQRRFGNLLSHPMLSLAKGMSLSDLAKRASKKLSPNEIQETIAELKNL